MAHCGLRIVSDVLRAISSRASASLFLLFLFLVPAHASNVSRDWLGGVPDSGQLAYEVTRKGKPLGFQNIDFSRAENGDLIVDVHIEIDYKFGPIKLFTYTHKNREIWRDGTMLSLKSRTDNNGKDVAVDLRFENGLYIGTGSRFENNLEGPLLSTSYFNPNFIRQTKLVSSQDGRLLPTKIDILGEETLKIDNKPVRATRFRLSGKLAIDIWYTQAGRWVKTQFERGRNKLVVKETNPSRLPPRKKWRQP